MHNLRMKAHKFDPALVVALQQRRHSGSRFSVTVRVVAPLAESQLVDLTSLGVQAEARKSILVAELDREGLAALSDIEGVVSVSLSQTLRPTGSRTK